MKRLVPSSKVWIAAGGAIALLCGSGRLFAQSCAMCYTSAAAGKEGAIRALQQGILILVFPPLIIFAGICVSVLRMRDTQANHQSERSITIARWFGLRRIAALVDRCLRGLSPAQRRVYERITRTYNS